MSPISSSSSGRSRRKDHWPLSPGGRNSMSEPYHHSSCALSLRILVSGCLCVSLASFFLGMGGLANVTDTHTPPQEILVPRVQLPTDTELSPSRFDRAYRESLGFFDDLSDEQWERRKRITLARRHNRNDDNNNNPHQNNHAPTWYQENWDPDFACLFEDSLGNEGDGHKWVCDPHRIQQVSERRTKQQKQQQQQHGCLVYSIGSEGKFDFEQDLQELLPMCEIHVFDMGFYQYHVPPGLNVTFHQWGLSPSNTNDLPFPRSYAFHSPYIPGKGERIWEQEGNEDKFKSFQQTVKELGHEGRVLDILKMDCEGCEWFTYKDWALSGVVDVRQILVELHDAPLPTVNDFFEDLHAANYVLFHKEPNIQYAGGACIEVSFLKLDQSFFVNATYYESIGKRRRHKDNDMALDDFTSESFADEGFY